MLLRSSIIKNAYQLKKDFLQRILKSVTARWVQKFGQETEILQTIDPIV